MNDTWEIREDGYYFIEEAENVLALRTSKMRHFLGLRGVVPHVATIRYEDLAADPSVLAAAASAACCNVARQMVSEALSAGSLRFCGDTRALLAISG